MKINAHKMRTEFREMAAKPDRLPGNNRKMLTNFREITIERSHHKLAGDPNTGYITGKISLSSKMTWKLARSGEIMAQTTSFLWKF